MLEAFFVTLHSWQHLGVTAIPAPSSYRSPWWRDGEVSRQWMLARVARPAPFRTRRATMPIRRAALAALVLEPSPAT